MNREDDHWVLENEELRVVVNTRRGGKIESLLSKSTDSEFLLQKDHSFPDECFPSGHNNLFQDSTCAGVDECLPTVAACDAETPGGPVPDHGDFWQLPWSIVGRANSQEIRLGAFGFSRPLYFERHLQLYGQSLRIFYRVRNLTNSSIPFLYACHPLLSIDAGDRVLLPPEIERVKVESSRNSRLGDKGDWVAWPKPYSTKPEIDLSYTGPRSTGTGDMVYAGPMTNGSCGLYRTQLKKGIVLRFDPTLLPYIGLWLCYDGWPEEPKYPKQYAVALEPTVAPHGALKEAIGNASAPELQALADFSWSIDFEILGCRNKLSYEEFVAECLELRPTK